MPQFEAVFADGMVATFEADSMRVADGVVILEKTEAGATSTVVAIGAGQLVFVRDTDVEVEIMEADDDWDDDDDAWDDDDDDEEEADEPPGIHRAPR